MPPKAPPTKPTAGPKPLAPTGSKSMVKKTAGSPPRLSSMSQRGRAADDSPPRPGAPASGTKAKKQVKQPSIGRKQSTVNTASSPASPPASSSANSSAPGSPSGEKPKPKTLVEVAATYGFTLASLRAANPSLSALGDNDTIPKGTKMSLPKRTPENTIAGATAPATAPAPASSAKAPGASGSPKKMVGAATGMAMIKQKAEEARQKAEAKKAADEEAARRKQSVQQAGSPLMPAPSLNSTLRHRPSATRGMMFDEDPDTTANDADVSLSPKRTFSSIPRVDSINPQSQSLNRPPTSASLNSTMNRTTSQIGSPAGSPGGTTGKPKAPKTLQDVADNYNFTMEEVRQANPGLSHLQDRDKIPVGTKLQLPKRKPTLAQLGARLELAESQARGTLASAFEKEDDNFWYHLRVEKRALLRLHEEQTELWKEHKKGAEVLSRQRAVELKHLYDQEREGRQAFQLEQTQITERSKRQRLEHRWEAEFDALKKREAYFRDVLVNFVDHVTALADVDEPARRQEIDRDEVFTRVTVCNQRSIETDDLAGREQIDCAETIGRDGIRRSMRAEGGSLMAFLVALNDTLSGEASERKTLLEDSTTEWRTLENNFRVWTVKMIRTAALADDLFGEEAEDEERIHRMERRERGDLRTAANDHHTWTERKLGEQAILAMQEERARSTNVHTMYLQEFVDILKREAPPRVNTLESEGRDALEAGEQVTRDHLGTVAAEMHEAAAAFFEDMVRVAGEESPQRTSTIDEEDDRWVRLLAWHERKKVMVLRGMDEFEYFDNEEEQARDAIEASYQSELDDLAREATVFKAIVLRLLEEQDTVREAEVAGRASIEDAEAELRSAAAASEAVDRETAWRAYCNRRFATSSAELEAEEIKQRDVNLQLEVADWATLSVERAESHAAAAKAEAERLAWEEAMKELLEQQRIDRADFEGTEAHARSDVDQNWSDTVFADVLSFGVVSLEAVARESAVQSAEATERRALAQQQQAGRVEVQLRDTEAEEENRRDCVASGERDHWRAICDQHNEDGFALWAAESGMRRNRTLAALAWTETSEENERASMETETNDRFDEIVQRSALSIVDAKKRQREREEATRRAYDAWKEKQRAARSVVEDDEEPAARETNIVEPETRARERLAASEGRQRVHLIYELLHRDLFDTESRGRDTIDDEAMRGVTRLVQRSEGEGDAILAREREREEMRKRMEAQRQQAEDREGTFRVELVDEEDAVWAKLRGAEKVENHAARAATFERELGGKLRAIETSEAAARQTDLVELFEASLPALEDQMVQGRIDAEAATKERKRRELWELKPNGPTQLKLGVLMAQEADGRSDLEQQYDLARRSWLDAIEIDEHLFADVTALRPSTRRRLALVADEQEDRSLLMLLESLIRLQLEERFDRAVLLDWEERTSDALHGQAIDSLDAYLLHGPSGLAMVESMYFSPVCYPRPTFEEESTLHHYGTSIPTLAGDSYAITPRPPLATIQSLDTTPARVNHRLQGYPLRGQAGTPEHLYSLMQRFDDECRSELSTPFSSPTLRAERSRARQGSFGGGGSQRLTPVRPTSSGTLYTPRAIEGPKPVPPPPGTAPRLPPRPPREGSATLTRLPPAHASAASARGILKSVTRVSSASTSRPPR